jgi:Ca2+-binding RTX toxin-like protein
MTITGLKWPSFTCLTLLTLVLIFGKGIVPVTSFIAFAQITEGTKADDKLVGNSPGLSTDGIAGHAGDDYIYGDYGNDVIDGLNGSDHLSGGPGDDTINGGDGADFIQGGEGNDKLFGDAGDDKLQGGPGADLFDCGDGNDVVEDFNATAGDTALSTCELIEEDND